MNTKKIKEADISQLKIASLPSRPTAPTSFGGKGFTATEMKEAFDKLPLYIISRLNSLIDDIEGTGEGSVAASIPTGIKEGHSLALLFSDIASGEVGNYLSVLGEPLNECIMALKEAAESHPEDIGAIEAALAELTGSLTALEGKLTEAKGALGEAAEEIDTLAADIATAAADILLIDTEIEEAREEISALRESGLEADARITALGERAATMESEITALAENAATMEGEITALGENAATMEDEITTIRENTATMESEITALGENVTSMEGEITALGENAATMEGKITALGERAGVIEGEVTTLATRLDELDERLDGVGEGGGSIFYPETEWEHDVTLTHGMEARVGYADGIMIHFPDELPDDYYAILSFYSGDIEPYLMLVETPDVYFSGACTEEGEFYPSCNQYYTLFFWFDTVMHCNVRAVNYYG